MIRISIESADYKAELSNGFVPIALRFGADAKVSENGNVLACCDSSERLADALFDFIMEYIRPSEIKRLIEMYPAEAREELLSCALNMTADTPSAAEAKRALAGYVNENGFLIAEGFLRFRLQFLLEEWAGAVLCASDDMGSPLEEKEPSNRLSEEEAVCGAYFGDVDMLLYSDGSFALTDGAGCRLECDAADTGSIIKLLASLLPRRLTVYDLSGGSDAELMRSIKLLFGKRARIFIKAE